MDPETAVSELNECIALGELQQAREHAENIREWIAKGGYSPNTGIVVNTQSMDLIISALPFIDDRYLGMHQFTDEDGARFGSFEVFHSDDAQGLGECGDLEPGFYWWACWDGCLPDGDPTGPFDTAMEAYDDAQDI